MKHNRLDTYELSIPVDASRVDPALTRVQIEIIIAGISEDMRGPLSDLDRAMLNNERRTLRARLAQLAS